MTAVVIGAGPAGLTAAWALLKEKGIRPVVLEAGAAAGGLSRTHIYKGNRMDLGGHRFFTEDEEIRDIWRALLPAPPDPAAVWLTRPRVSHILYRGRFFDYPVTLTPATLRGLGLGSALRAGFGYLASAARPRREDSLEDFYINRFGRPLYEMFFEEYTEKLWGVHPSRIAPDWGAQRVRGLSLRKAASEALRRALRPGYQTGERSLIEEFWYPKLGPGQLWEAMAREITTLGGEIRFHARADGVRLEGGKVACVRAGGEEFHADVYISTMPVKDLAAAMEEMPPRVRALARALPYRDFITAGLLVQRLKRPVPDTWMYIQERQVRMGRLQIFNNWSPWLAADPQTTWLGLEYFCTQGDALWNMPQPDFLRFAAGELAQIGLLDSADVLDGTVLRVPKAYPAYFGSYREFDQVRAYLDGIPNLRLAGRNGLHCYSNMDQAMRSALDAVRSCVN